MTDSTARKKADELTPEQVADYLRAHPDFFLGQDELLRSLTLPHESGRAISLVERQVHLFREQRDTLRRELVELVSIARHNDRLFEKSKRLLLQVIEARSLSEAAAAIDDSIRGDFGLDAAAVLLFMDAPAAGTCQGALRVVSPDSARARLGRLLDSERAVCGQFRDEERAFLVPRPAGSGGLGGPGALASPRADRCFRGGQLPAGVLRPEHGLPVPDLHQRHPEPPAAPDAAQAHGRHTGPGDGGTGSLSAPDRPWTFPPPCPRRWRIFSATWRPRNATPPIPVTTTGGT